MNLFAMSNLRSTETGVTGAVIWVSAGEFASAYAKLGPRIVVLPGNEIASSRLKDGATVLLTAPPDVLSKLPGEVEHQVVRFAALNRDVLLRHWNGEIDAREMLDLLERI